MSLNFICFQVCGVRGGGFVATGVVRGLDLTVSSSQIEDAQVLLDEGSIDADI